MGLVPVAVTIAGSRQSGAVPLIRLMPSLIFCIASAFAIGSDALGDLLQAQSYLPFFGLLAAIASLICWTIFALINSQYLARLQNISAHDWSLLIGLMAGAQGLLMLPIALATVSLNHSSADWGLFVIACAGVALLSSIGGNGFWNQANRLLPLTLVGQMVLFETIFALLYAFWWESRGPTVAEMVAFACVIISTLLCITAHRRPIPNAAPEIAP
jgi:drug/metabolite transporter (DMT)-like permease